MHTIWQVQEAKNRFSEMIERAMTVGPQVITRHGRAVVQVVAASPIALAPDSSILAQPTATDGFAQYLLSAPREDGLELPVRRSRISTITLGD